MKRFVNILIAIIFVGYSLPAQAKFLEIWAQGNAGGLVGLYSHPSIKWTDGQEHQLQDDTDYYMVHSGPGYGASVGLEFLFVDIQVDFLQLLDSSGNVSSNLLNFMIGLDADFDYGSMVWTPFLFVGAAFGTTDSNWLNEEHPQLTHDDLDSQILFAKVGVRLEYKITELFRISLEGGIGGHFIQKAYLPANAEESKSMGAHGYGLLGLRVVFDVFGNNETKDSEDHQDIPPELRMSYGAGGSSSSNKSKTNDPKKKAKTIIIKPK